MYMSYCRFEGTHQELKACLADVDEHLAEMAEYEVSEDEVDHFRDMVKDFIGWMQEYGKGFYRLDAGLRADH